jgi:amidase
MPEPISRRSALALTAAATPVLGRTTTSYAGPLDELGVTELAARMANGRLDAVRLTRYHLDRIRRIDRSGPELRSMIEVNPDALAEARRLDRERRTGRVRGPLHGLPVVLKDNLETGDRMHTTAGSLALEGLRPAADSTVAARLRAAGAVLLGKTNLSEWAGGMSLTHHAGYSARGGQTRNPYKLDRSPHESSSGSAVATAANLCVASIGTETNGSIIDPASANCVVGLKPTVGLVGRGGLIPGVPNQDSIGPIARSVSDAAILLGLLTGVDRRDPATKHSHHRRDYTRFLDPDGLRGARIGVPRKVYFGYSQHADEIAERAIEVLRAAGATVVDPADIPTAEQLEDTPSSVVVQVYEIKRALGAYLADSPGDHPRSLAGIIAFNREHADRELRYTRQDGLELLNQLDFTEREYREALATNHRLSRAEGIDAVLRRHDLDALVMPTAGPPAKIDLVRGDTYGGGASTPAALAGYPAISVPAGFAHGLPVGLTFIGTAWSEPVLLRLAYAYERRSQVRRTPSFRPADVGF